MDTISYSSSSNEHQSTANDNPSAERRVILIGFDSDRVKEILADKTITKLVIFDDTDDTDDTDNADNARSKFEKVYPIYGDRITLYEGDVESNLNWYLRLREKEGINLEMHRFEIHNNHFRLFKV
jgi:hypothetical protein